MAGGRCRVPDMPAEVRSTFHLRPYGLAASGAAASAARPYTPYTRSTRRKLQKPGTAKTHKRQKTPRIVTKDRKHLESTRTAASRQNSQTKHQVPSKGQPKSQVAKHQTAQQPCTPPAQQHPACALSWWGKCRCARALQPPASPTPRPPRPCLLSSIAPRLLIHLSLPPQQRNRALGMGPLPGTPQLSL